MLRAACSAAIASALSVAVTGCAVSSDLRINDPIVTLAPLATDDAVLAMAPGVRVLRAYAITSHDPRFGGFSGIASDGHGLWLLSDRATLWHAPLTIDGADGSISFGSWSVHGILADNNDRLPLDSEDLALTSAGALVAAFEHDQSLRRLEPAGPQELTTGRLHEGPLVAGTPANRGLEAVAALPDDSFIALAEDLRDELGLVVGARLTEGGIVPLRYQAAPGFSITGAAASRDELYIVERQVGLMAGWRTRVTVTGLPAEPRGTLGDTRELLRIDGGGLGENYEGIAVVERGDERLLLLISDDNFLPIQRTLLLVLAHAG